jgi:EAL domain-containing protein (putative c-di-GMP-specific phosphodiesterase class I)
VALAAPRPANELTLEEALPLALETGELTVAYQPLVDVATGAVAGLEALARWQHAGQQVPPRVFVQVAQRLDLLPRLTALVADSACEQLRRWCDAVGHERLTVAVNLELEQLADTALHAQLQAVREAHRLRPGQLVLEIPAVAVGPDAARAVRVSRELAERGTPLSLSGLNADASLGLLHRLSLASVKARDVYAGSANGAERDDRLLRALKGLGRELDVVVVVEGVERQRDLTSVRALGGLLVQGFALARPSTAADLDQVIVSGLPAH